MLSATITIALLSSTACLAAPVRVFRREVPQEHSHEPFLRSVATSLALDNPDEIVDPVFGLLGNAAAQAGLGNIADPDCLQQATADQAFTNSKAAGDVQGQVDALIYRALERNTGKVGQASVACTSIEAVNPEIAAIQQHQDPASDGAAATNKAIVLELAKQIAAVGGDPLDALKSGTFAAGDVDDPTGAGNTCDDADDAEGCIFSQNLIVFDATEDEINAAVAGADNGDGAADGAADGADDGAVDDNADDAADNAGNDAADGAKGAADADATAACPAAKTVTVTASAATATASADSGDAEDGADDSTATATSSAAAESASASAGSDDADDTDDSDSGSAADSGNLQTFTGDVGGLPPAVTAGGRGFEVEGSDDFLNVDAALGRSCDIQHNACANLANSAEGRASGLSVGQCDEQNTECRAAI